MKCSSCHAEKRVMLTHTASIGKRKIEWSICVGCELAERKEQDKRAAMAVEQAERSGC